MNGVNGTASPGASIAEVLHLVVRADGVDSLSSGEVQVFSMTRNIVWVF